MAKRGKTSTGWFYGFKLHLIINDVGEILVYMLTAGDVDDRVPVPELAKDLLGKLFGDKGYISQELFLKLYEKELEDFRAKMAKIKAGEAVSLTETNAPKIDRKVDPEIAEPTP